MEISQLLPASSASTTSKGPQDSKTDGADFAQMLKQSGKAASAKQPGSDAASEPSSDPLVKAPEEDVAAGETLPEPEATDGGAAQLPEAMVPGAAPQVVEAAAAGSPAGTPVGLSPLTQNIAQALSARLTPQPTQPPVIADTATSALKASQAALNGSETLDLAAIRERLTTIANAQHGTAVLPTATLASAAGSFANAGQATQVAAKGSYLPVNDRIASLQSQVATSRHQPLTAQSLNVSTQNPATALPSAGQPTTFMDAITTNPAAADLTVAGRGGVESHASQVQTFAGNLTGTSLGSAGQTQASPAQVLNAPLATPQWQQGLGQQLVALHQRGAQQMDLHLRPADLGPLTISLKVDDQLAQLQLFSSHPQVRAAIEQAIPQLRQALEESGIQLGEATVGEQRQQGDGDSRSADTALAARDDSNATATDEEVDIVATTGRSLTGNGNAVDLYA